MGRLSKPTLGSSQKQAGLEGWGKSPRLLGQSPALPDSQGTVAPSFPWRGLSLLKCKEGLILSTSVGSGKVGAEEKGPSLTGRHLLYRHQAGDRCLESQSQVTTL